MSPSPEKQKRRADSIKDIAETLESHPDAVKAVKLKAFKPHPLLPLSDSNEMAKHRDGTHDVNQHLRAMVKAGNELFGIVDISVVDPKGKEPLKATAVTRHTPDKPADLVALLGFDQEPLVVGRKSDENLSPTTSREHFVVARDERGVVGIADLNSGNGTTLYEPTGYRDSEADDSPKTYDSSNSNPLENPRLWSVSPADIRALVDSSVA